MLRRGTGTIGSVRARDFPVVDVPPLASVTFEVWAGAALLLALAVLYGRALTALGVAPPAAAPAVGFGVELIAANIGSELPGLAYTGALILLVLAVVALAVCVLRGERPRLDAAPWVVLAVAVFLCALPFLSNGRTGLLGVSLDNDTAAHLLYAAALASSSVAHALPAPTYYPLAPHALAAALTDGTGIRLDAAFDSFTIATLLVTALVGSAALGREGWWRRVVAGTIIAFFYLEAAYYGEDSFKELILGMLLLGFVVCLEGIREAWTAREGARWSVLIPLAFLFAAGLYSYGYLAAAWYVLIIVIWALSEMVADRRWSPREWRALGREVAVPVVIAAVATVALLAPITNRLLSLFSVFGVSPNKAITVTNIGDLSGKISPYEALGIWQSLDFRSAPANVFHAGELGAFALAVLLFGVAAALRRRQYALFAGVLACALVYFESAHSQSAYVTAKSLTIAAPLVALAAMRGLLRSGGPKLSVPAYWLRGAVAAVFVVFAVWSSSLVLRSEPVWPMTGPDELMTLSHLTRGSKVLFFGSSEYATWLFDRSTLAGIVPTAQTVASGKAAPVGAAVDWDNASAATLNHYRWVVTTNSTNASQAPAAFQLVRRMRMYELWRRVGTVVPRESIDPPNDPGGVLDCSTQFGRRISRKRGVAAVMTEPIAVGVGVLPIGASPRVSLPLPAGRWELSLQYVSGVPIRVTELGGPSWAVPAYLDQIGPFFSFAQVRSYGGRMTLEVSTARPSIFTIRAAFLEAQVEAIVATRVPDTRTLVPLRRACGRYIDWYRASRP